MDYDEILLNRSYRSRQFSDSCLHEIRKTIEDNCFTTNVIDVITSGMIKSFRGGRLYLLSKYENYTLGTGYSYSNGNPVINLALRPIYEVSMKGGYPPIYECSRN